MHCCHGCGTEERFSEPGAGVQTGVVVTDFSQICKRSFGDNGFDSWLDGGGLQRDGSAHGDTERVKMPDLLAGIENVGDGDCVMALLPAVRGHIAAALTVGACVHPHEAGSMTKHEFRIARVAGSIV